MVAVTRHTCMMCIPSNIKVLWSWGLLLPVERVVIVPLPAMSCHICCQPLAGAESPAVPLKCRHTFHLHCLEMSRLAHGFDTISTMKCPTCKLTGSGMAEMQAAAQSLGAGDGSSQSVPEMMRSQSSQDDHGVAPNQAASPTQDALSHGSSSQVAPGDSPDMVAVPVAPGVPSDIDFPSKRFKWNNTQGIAVERKVPGSRCPQLVGPKHLETPATPEKSQHWGSQFTPNSQPPSPGLSEDDFHFSYNDATRRSSDRSEEISDPVVAAPSKQGSLRTPSTSILTPRARHLC